MASRTRTPTPAPIEGLGPSDLAEMVRRALPTARRIIALGITDHDLIPGERHEHSLASHLVALRGHDWIDNDPNEFDDLSQAAYALGIAVGVHLQRSIFEVTDDGR